MSIVDKIDDYLNRKLFLKKGEIALSQEEKDVVEKFMKLASSYNVGKFANHPGKRLAYLIQWYPHNKLSDDEQELLRGVLKKLRKTIKDVKDTEIE